MAFGKSPFLQCIYSWLCTLLHSRGGWHVFPNETVMFRLMRWDLGSQCLSSVKGHGFSEWRMITCLWVWTLVWWSRQIGAQQILTIDMKKVFGYFISSLSNPIMPSLWLWMFQSKATCYNSHWGLYASIASKISFLLYVFFAMGYQ